MLLEIRDIGIEVHFAIAGIRQVAVLGVPRHITLVETHLVATPLQSTDECPVGGGMTITPGRSNGQSENDNVEWV
jgi:hypothetical protein